VFCLWVLLLLRSWQAKRDWHCIHWVLFPSKEGLHLLVVGHWIWIWSIHVYYEFKSIPLEWSFPSNEGFHLLVVGYWIWIWIWSIHVCCEFKSIPFKNEAFHKRKGSICCWWCGNGFGFGLFMCCEFKSIPLGWGLHYLIHRWCVVWWWGLVSSNEKVNNNVGLFHIYLSICWSISLQIWLRSRFHVLVGLLWKWMRSKFFVNYIVFFTSTYLCVGQSFCKFE